MVFLSIVGLQMPTVRVYKGFQKFNKDFNITVFPTWPTYHERAWPTYVLQFLRKKHLRVVIFKIGQLWDKLFLNDANNFLFQDQTLNLDKS